MYFFKLNDRLQHLTIDGCPFRNGIFMTENEKLVERLRKNKRYNKTLFEDRKTETFITEPNKCEKQKSTKAYTNLELTQMLKEKGIKVPRNPKKAKLIAMVKEHGLYAWKSDTRNI